MQHVRDAPQGAEPGREEHHVRHHRALQVHGLAIRPVGTRVSMSAAGVPQEKCQELHQQYYTQ